jgi:LPS sulfotransferase NodH
MTQSFRSFVIFAEMRTGSNLLEATLNGLRGVTCFGEAFNPYMMGWPDKDELEGVTRAEREADPMVLLNTLFNKPDHMAGFRYFHDHDPRVFDAIMNDPRCAKIILTRNPLDSYVSTLVARETNQWKLNETEVPIPATVTYEGPEFRDMLSAIENFQLRVMHRLQVTGQSGFWLGYEDLRDADVMTGLAHWMGRTEVGRLDPASDQIPQNAREMADKVQNFDQMQVDLQQVDPFTLRRIPNFEPRRGPSVPSFWACEAGNGMLYMPVRCGPGPMVRDWMSGLGQVGKDFTQSSLRQWKRKHPGHRSFTVLRHPLHRAWTAFGHVLTQASPELRQVLRDVYQVPLPADEALPDMALADRITLFEDFLGFLRRNLNGQTTLPTHPDWASQSEGVSGFSRFATPDMLIREDRLSDDIAMLAGAAGVDSSKLTALIPEKMPEFLLKKSLVAAAKAVYLRDYIAFGFEDPI